MPFEVPLSIVGDVKVWVAVIVEIEPRGAGYPGGLVEAALHRSICERAVAVVDEKTERFIDPRQMDVGKAVRIKIGR